MHRDIKPQNILIDETKTAKIADFSVAKKVPINDDTLYGIEGTYYFASPEMLVDKEKGNIKRIFWKGNRCLGTWSESILLVLS